MRKILGLLLLVASAPSIAATASDVEKRNKETGYRVFEERLTNGDISKDDELFTPDFHINGGTRNVGLEEDQDAVLGWKSAFPDLKVDVTHVVADGDLLAVRWHVTGTNTGTGNGLPATGKKVDLRATSLFRMEDGRIAESWAAFDRYALFQQLGLVTLDLNPKPAASPAQ